MVKKPHNHCFMMNITHCVGFHVLLFYCFSFQGRCARDLGGVGNVGRSRWLVRDRDVTQQSYYLCVPASLFAGSVCTCVFEDVCPESKDARWEAGGQCHSTDVWTQWNNEQSRLNDAGSLRFQWLTISLTGLTALQICGMFKTSQCGQSKLQQTITWGDWVNVAGRERLGGQTWCWNIASPGHQILIGCPSRWWQVNMQHRVHTNTQMAFMVSILISA